MCIYIYISLSLSFCPNVFLYIYMCVCDCVHPDVLDLDVYPPTPASRGSASEEQCKRSKVFSWLQKATLGSTSLQTLPRAMKGCLKALPAASLAASPALCSFKRSKVF